MKYLFFALICINSITSQAQNSNCNKIVIVTIDGVRWQEIFEGADSSLLSKIENGKIAKTLYWNQNLEQRRKLLMPFLWSYIVENGQLLGNRNYGNKMQVKNNIRLSYAGYNEIFTGIVDNNILSNKPNKNKNSTVLSYLNKKNKDSIAVFSSWQLFPYIFNETKSALKMNCGYNYNNTDTTTNEYEEQASIEKRYCNNLKQTRKDMLTFLAAKEYLTRAKPSILHIALGEADEFAHQNMYKEYLSNLNLVDRMIAELWQTIQEDKSYKDQTIMIITTDHGRGSKDKNWNKHGMFVKGSNQTWMAIIGNCIKPTGEVKDKFEIYNAQIAEAIANFKGESFFSENIYDISLANILK